MDQAPLIFCFGKCRTNRFFDAGKTIVNVFIAGERDDTLVASTASSEEETDSGDSQAE